jgi:hypothetical protein
MFRKIINKLIIGAIAALILIFIVIAFASIFSQSATEVVETQWSRLLREFSIFINLILIVLLALFIISFYETIKYLRNEEKIKNQARIFLHLFAKDPAWIFSQLSGRDKNGTYMGSFERYKRFQLFSKKTFIRTLGLAMLQVIILFLLLYGLSFFTHKSRAQESNLIQSSNFFMELKK